MEGGATKGVAYVRKSTTGGGRFFLTFPEKWGKGGVSEGTYHILLPLHAILARLCAGRLAQRGHGMPLASCAALPRAS